MLRAVLFLIFFVPFTLLIIVTGVPVTFLDPTGKFLHAYARIWGRGGLFLARVRMTVHGREHVPAGIPVIYMGNHQSNFDILALYAALPGQFRWLAKEELFRIPFFGYAMRRAGYISIDRSHPRQAVRSISAAADRIRQGTSVVVFPEGTRSYDGALLPFKRGGFQLAAKAGVPIVPVIIQGSLAINPRNRLELYPGSITIRYGEPVQTEGATPEILMERVRGALTAKLPV